MSSLKKRQNTKTQAKSSPLKPSVSTPISSNSDSTPNPPWYDNAWLGAILVAILAFVLYSNTLSHDFAMDDPLVVSGNKYIQRGAASISDIFNTSYLEGFSGQREATYRPLALTAFALEKDFFGGSAGAYHWLNVLWYLATCVLVYALLRNLLMPRGMGYLALLIALLFTAHRSGGQYQKPR
jgi:protein O-mannosyl-transferase